MKALILNSGMGTRMGAVTRNHPKCMTEIAPGETILSRQLRLLAEAGIREAVITTGYFDEVLREYCASLSMPLSLTFARNPAYRETNYIYSIRCAEEYLHDDILLQDMRTLYIDDICVDEQARGKHVGKQLFDHVRAYAEKLGCGAITLNVWEGNDAAMAFYRKLGMSVRKTCMEMMI